MTDSVTISNLDELTSLNQGIYIAGDTPSETYKITLETFINYVQDKLLPSPTGTIYSFCGETVPTGYIELLGQNFNTLLYPELATLFPSGTLPDTTGMILKHKDSTRTILSYEAQNIAQHGHTATATNATLDNIPFTLPDHRHYMVAIANSYSSYDRYRYLSNSKNAPLSQSVITSSQEGDYVRNSSPEYLSYISNYNNGGDTAYYEANTALTSNPSSSASSNINLGSHTHAINVNNYGSGDNLVDNIAVKFIVRLA